MERQNQKEILVERKSQAENEFSPHQRSEMNAIVRRMKSRGVPVDEFLEIFPGNSFVEFCNNRRKIKRLRERINSAAS